MKVMLKLFFPVLIFGSVGLSAQVQVREEPRHRPVFQNKYLRLLDVVLKPKDTSLYHIHSTPSLFVYLSGPLIATQIKGKDWVNEQTVAGKAWFRSFSPDSLIHRVCNLDTFPLHVNDVEILSPYNTFAKQDKSPLPFPLLFNNEKSVAYKLSKADLTGLSTTSRGPLVVEMVKGEVVVYYDERGKRPMDLKTGKFLYIEPGTSFRFLSNGEAEMDIVLFEIK